MNVLSVIVGIINYSLEVCIIYSIVILIISLRLHFNKAVIYLNAAILFLSLFANQWQYKYNIDFISDINWLNIKYIFFYISMLLLAKTFLLLGLNKKILKSASLVFIIFTLINIIGLLFNINILLTIKDNQIETTALYKIIFFPALTAIFILVFIEMIKKMRQAAQFNKKMIKFIVIGTFYLIIFGVIDMIGFMFIGSFSSYHFQWSTLGIVIFALHTLFLITEIIFHNLQRKKLLIFQSHIDAHSIDKKDKKKYDIIVNTIIGEKLYSKPELNLTDFSEYVNLSRNEVSRIINIHGGENFNSFINRYRVNELKIMLADKQNKNKSILELAFDVGFNSKATLNRIFKKSEKISPKEYRDRFC